MTSNLETISISNGNAEKSKKKKEKKDKKVKASDQTEKIVKSEKMEKKAKKEKKKKTVSQDNKEIDKNRSKDKTEKKKKEKKEKKTPKEESSMEVEATQPKKRNREAKEKRPSKKTKTETSSSSPVDSDAPSPLAKIGSGRGAHKFQRVFFTPPAPPADHEDYLKKHDISLDGDAPPPLRAFADTPVPPALLKCCASFKSPTPIQSSCWPIALAGRDLVGIAETGSGKTIAFAVPVARQLVDRLEKEPKGKGPMALVLAPTRELVAQVAEVFEEVGKHCGVTSHCIYGGIPSYSQIEALEKGVHVIVATPGRLLDLMNQGYCPLGRVSFLVLDEADRMLDMGFEPDIRRIVGEIRSDRQTLMFSATWPESIQQLATKYLCNPARVTIGSLDLAANHRVTQIVEVIDDRARDERLQQLLRQYHKSRKNRILIFALYKKEAARVEGMLLRRGWNAVGIHGDVSQASRNSALASFKDGSVPLLIATDVAARGLDIPDVEYVINYAFPLTTEDYVHRIGRTGRGGKTGTAHTFFTLQDKNLAGELVQVLKEAKQTVPPELEKFGPTIKKKVHKLYGAFTGPTGPMKKSTHVKFD